MMTYGRLIYLTLLMTGMHMYCSYGLTSMFEQSIEIDDSSCNGDNQAIQLSPSNSVMRCAAKCIQTAGCVAFQYNSANHDCLGNQVNTSTVCQSENGSVKFVKFEECGQPPNVDNAHVTFSRKTIGSPTAYTCSAGYALIGFGAIHCQPDLEWTVPAFSCEICPDPEVVISAIVSSGSYLIGSQRTYTCTQPTNHIMIGNPQITCQEDATWTSIGFECRRPGSCTELKTCNSGYTNDGEYWVWPAYYPGERIRVYCQHMATTSPLDFITLNYLNEFHYDASVAWDYWEKNGNCALFNKYGDRTTQYQKIRINTTTMIVDRSDQAFSTSYLEEGDPMLYGEAGDCAYVFNCLPRQGYFIIDTRETGVVVNTTLNWIGTSYIGRFHDFVRTSDGRQISAKCGGSCGGCAPETDMRLEVDVLGAPPQNTGQVHTCL